jgi:predicted lipid-binding transport protein (Tim44 family)
MLYLVIGVVVVAVAAYVKRESLKVWYADFRSGREARKEQATAAKEQKSREKKTRTPTGVEIWLRRVGAILGNLGIALTVGVICAIIAGVASFLTLHMLFASIGFAGACSWAAATR